MAPPAFSFLASTVLVLGVACGAAAPTPAPGSAARSTDTADTAPPEGPLEDAFRFVVLADTHVTGPGDAADRLDAAVAWVNAHAEERGITLAVVLGDIAWGDGFPTAVASLSSLTVPWVPVMGDNEIHSLDEETFFVAFADQMAVLQEELDNFAVAPAPVDNPDWGRPSWLQNLAFDHGPVRFLAVDWNSRDLETLWGETPDLHDFSGGTWPWLEGQFQDVADRPEDSVVLLSHMPLFAGPGGLTLDEAATVIESMTPVQGPVWGNFSGHLHTTSEMFWAEADLEIRVTDATWDDDNVLRVVGVQANAQRVVYTHELVVVEPGPSRSARAWWGRRAAQTRQ